MIHVLRRRAASREGVGRRSFYNRGGGETAGACRGGRICFHVELGTAGGDARAPIVELLEQWWPQHQGVVAGLYVLLDGEGMDRRSRTGSYERERRPRSTRRR